MFSDEISPDKLVGGIIGLATNRYVTVITKMISKII